MVPPTQPLRPPAAAPESATQVAPGVWWVGAPSPTGVGLVNAYLLQAGNTGVLVDPGSVLTLDAVLGKVAQVLPLSQIRAVIVHDPDPETAGCLLALGPVLGDHAIVITDEFSATALRHVGGRLPIRTVEALGHHVDLGGGRELLFVKTPYVRTPTSFATYDLATESLLSGSLFSARVTTASLAAQASDIENILRDHEVALPSGDVLAQCLSNVRETCPTLQRILPSRGPLLPYTILDLVFSQMGGLECGAANCHAAGAPPMVHLAGSVRRLREHVPLVHGLAELDRALRAELATGLPVLDTAFEAELPGEGIVRFGAENGFLGAVVRTWAEAKDDRLVVEVSGEMDDPRQRLIINTTGPASLDRDTQMLLPILWPAMRRVIQRAVDLRLDAKARRTLEELSRRDPLTGLYNRRMLDEIMPTGEMRGVMMIRVEGFVGINEDAGYDVGDLALQRVSAVLSSIFRQGDLLARYDGVDFLVVLRVQNRDELSAVADRVRMAVAACDLGAIAGARSLTASVGATLLNPDEPLLAGRRRADEALYDARRFGSDSVAIRLPAN